MPAFTPFSDRDLPLSIINDYSISRKTRAIYIGIIFFAILILASLAFINISLKDKTKGIIQSWPKDYEKVGSGDTLLLTKAD